MEEITEEAEIVQRVAALDIGKASLMACVRVPHETVPGRRRQEVRTFAATGTIGDGKLWVTGLADAMRVRTGERGAAAI